MPDDVDLMPVRAAAAQVGVSPSAVYVWMHRGLLAAQQERYGAQVSMAAVRTVAAAMAEKNSRHVLAPREVPGDTAEYVLPSVAARQAGVPAHTVGYWVRSGQVASKPYAYGRLVRLADVEARAAQRRTPAPGVDAGP